MNIYHIAYIITNLINGKKYAGVHKTTNLEDGYMGSGSLLKKAINKYGLESFQKEIVNLFDSENDMYLWESNFVTQEKVNDPMWYNLRTGGSGGYRIHPDIRRRLSESRKGKPRKPHSEETKKKLSEIKLGKKTNKPAWNRGKKHTDSTRLLLSRRNRERYEKMTPEERKTYGLTGERNGFFGRNHTEETRLILSQIASTKISCEQCGAFVQRMNYYRYHGSNCGKDHNVSICEHCGLKTTPGNYKRWHGTNCKHKSS